MKDNLYYNDFYTKNGVGVHDNPERFAAVAALCKGFVLDAACGTGSLSDYYFGQYLGVDFSEVAIEQAKKARRKNAAFDCVDFTKLYNYNFDLFDTVYLGEFLEHVENDEIVFQNIKNLSRPDVRIICTVPNGDRVPDESHVRTFTVPQIRKEYSKYGKVKFYNWSGFRDRILFTIEKYPDIENDISLVMIVKDEEKGIETAILSALELADNVVVSVDTKTTDKTAEIAKRYADELKFHEWKNDFSAARNFAQENVKTKWILFLDGHEFVESIGHVRYFLQKDVEGIMATMKMENGMTFHFPRLFRSYIKFKYAVHNLNECKTTVQCDDFVITHDRLNLQSNASILARQQQRDEMIPKIMGEMLKKDKKHVRALFHLGNFNMMRQHWAEAIKYYKRYLKYSDFKDEKYLVLLNTAICRQMRGQLARALSALTKADKLYPNRWETARLIGGNFFAQQNFKTALDWLVQSLGENNQVYHYQPFEKDLFEIWDLIAMCFNFLGQNEKALTAWSRALEIAKNDTQKKYAETKVTLVKSMLNSSNHSPQE
jgi:SAM-dependent methyltransferase